MTHVVVAAVLRRGSRVLLCHRSPSREHYPDAWDLPGGHVEDSESAYQALARELFEELGITLSPVPVEPARVEQSSDWHMTAWVLDDFEGEPTNCAPEEHDEIRWVDVSEIKTLQLAHPGDYEFLTSLGS